jgi:hypothetical protein
VQQWPTGLRKQQWQRARKRRAVGQLLKGEAKLDPPRSQHEAPGRLTAPKPTQIARSTSWRGGNVSKSGTHRPFASRR